MTRSHKYSTVTVAVWIQDRLVTHEPSSQDVRLPVLELGDEK